MNGRRINQTRFTYSCTNACEFISYQEDRIEIEELANLMMNDPDAFNRLIDFDNIAFDPVPPGLPGTNYL